MLRARWHLPMGDHDGLFKLAFRVPAHAAGEIRSVLPDGVASRLDLDRLSLVPASFVDDTLAHRHADLLFSVPFSGRPGFVYFLFEHQSAPDPLMPWRVLVYQQRIWASALPTDPARRSLPPIVTIVVHHGAGGWKAPTTFHEVVDGIDDLPELHRLIPDFELLVDDVAQADDAALQRRPLAPFPKVTLWVLRDARDMTASSRTWVCGRKSSLAWLVVTLAETTSQPSCATY